MTRLKQLWDALEDSPRLVGVQQELMDSLGCEYAVAAAFVRPNGKEARRYPCPSPGDPGCPRRIIKQADGQVRAVCGAESKECDPLSLAREDIQVLAFDSQCFGLTLQQVLGIPAQPPQLKHRGDVAYLGMVRAHSGVRRPVVLMMASSRQTARVLVADVERTYRQGAVLLTPTDQLIDGETESRLAQSGFTWIVLADILFADGTKFVLRRPLAELSVRTAAASPRAAAGAVHPFPTPPGTEWKDVHVRFKDGDTVTIKVGTVTEHVTYAEMGMKNANTGQATVLWKLLESFANKDGRFDWSHPDANLKIKHRICRLRKVLQRYFGLSTDPFFKYQKAVGYRVRFQIGLAG